LGEPSLNQDFLKDLFPVTGFGGDPSAGTKVASQMDADIATKRVNSKFTASMTKSLFSSHITCLLDTQFSSISLVTTVGTPIFRMTW
jgi:hypothetical protein